MAMIAMFKGYGEPSRRNHDGRERLGEPARIQFERHLADFDRAVTGCECDRALRSLLAAHARALPERNARLSLANARRVFRIFCRVAPRM